MHTSAQRQDTDWMENISPVPIASLGAARRCGHSHNLLISLPRQVIVGPHIQTAALLCENVLLELTVTMSRDDKADFLLAWNETSWQYIISAPYA
jgi:hypothetical protein